MTVSGRGAGSAPGNGCVNDSLSPAQMSGAVLQESGGFERQYYRGERAVNWEAGSWFSTTHLDLGQCPSFCSCGDNPYTIANAARKVCEILHGRFLHDLRI